MSKKQKKKNKKAKRKAKKLKKQAKKEKKQAKKRQMSFIDYHQIIEEEKLGQKLRIECFTILLYLIDQKDAEVKNIFTHNISNQSSLSLANEGANNLISDLEAKTEETFQALLVQHLTNEQQNMILQKRAVKD